MELSTGNIIKLARQKQGLTQSELGELLGVGKSTIQKYENGYVTNLKLETIRKLCNHLEVFPMTLIFPEGDSTISVEMTNCHHNEMLSSFLSLNHIGQTKTFEYMKDLLEIEKYQNQRNT